jgi:dihydrofolate reductase
MPLVRANITVSTDGFMAGPDQSVDHPMGVGAQDLHKWTFKLRSWREPHGMEGGEDNASSPIAEQNLVGVGATVMGRNMFGGGPGPWPDPAWTGWWGEEPPFHHPVFVLTNHPRKPLVMEGENTFTFVTDGPQSALAQAKDAAGDLDVQIGGGANTIQQFIALGLLDEIWISTAPVLLGSGERLLDADKLGGASLEQIDSIAGPDAVHAKYRVTL